MLILCLARPELAERRPQWLSRPEATLALEALSPVDSNGLLDALDAPADLRERIAELAEGNPLFIEQLAAGRVILEQLTIVEGTSQVQLGLIARGVLGRDLWWD